jgi:hypothetical protein
MLNNFYREAVIPKSLRLTGNDEATRNIVSREMDLYLNSGISGIVHRKDGSGDVVGCLFYACWNRNPDYVPLEGITMAEWYATAARVAMELDPARPEPIWRDLQYQHLYNTAQLKMTETGTDFAAYFGMAHLMPEARASGFAKACSIMMGKAVLVENGLPFAMPTVESLRGRAASSIKFAEVWGHVEYKDVGLLAVGGRPVFGEVFDKGGITLVSTDVAMFASIRKSKL